MLLFLVLVSGSEDDPIETLAFIVYPHSTRIHPKKDKTKEAQRSWVSGLYKCACTACEHVFFHVFPIGSCHPWPSFPWRCVILGYIAEERLLLQDAQAELWA